MVQSDLGEASPKSERDWKSNLGTKKRVKRHPNLNEIGKAISHEKVQIAPSRKKSLNSKSGISFSLYWGKCVGEYRYGKNNAEPYGSRLSDVSERI